jgi:hypothetical protein
MRRLAAIALAGCTAGVDPDADADLDDDCATGDITLSVGSGAESYEPLVSGDRVIMVHGPQGGWHVETAGLVERSEKDVSIQPSIVAGDIDVTGVLQPDYRALVGYDDDQCSGTFFGTRAFVDYDRDDGPSGQVFICSLEGAMATFSVRVQDIVSLREVTSAVEVMLDLDPVDVYACHGQ